MTGLKLIAPNPRHAAHADHAVGKSKRQSPPKDDAGNFGDAMADARTKLKPRTEAAAPAPKPKTATKESKDKALKKTKPSDDQPDSQPVADEPAKVVDDQPEVTPECHDNSEEAQEPASAADTTEASTNDQPVQNADSLPPELSSHLVLTPTTNTTETPEPVAANNEAPTTASQVTAPHVEQQNQPKVVRPASELPPVAKAQDKQDETVATSEPEVADEKNPEPIAGPRQNTSKRTAAHDKHPQIDSQQAQKQVAGTQTTESAPAAAMAKLASLQENAKLPEFSVELAADSQPKQSGPVIPQNVTVAVEKETAPAEAAPVAQDSPVHNPSDTMDQIVLGLKGKLDARTGKAEISLNPPNLGQIKVSISLDNGLLTADFQSASDLVRDLLKSNLDKLKSVLQSQGVAIDRLAVDGPPIAASGGQQDASGNATHDGRSAGQYQQDGRQGQRRTDSDAFARMFRQTQDASPFEMVA